MGERIQHLISVKVTVEFVIWYAIEEVVRASRLLMVVNGSMHVSRGRASCKHLAMTALLPAVTKFQEKKCRCRTLAGKQASCAIKHGLMSDGVADGECMVLSIIILK